MSPSPSPGDTRIAGLDAVSVQRSLATGELSAENPCAAANPCAANPCSPGAANPCGANPFAANPCAANPCNPCAANPCGAKMDPSRPQEPAGAPAPQTSEPALLALGESGAD